MVAAQKPLILFFTFILFLCVIMPMPITYAEAHVTKFAIQDASSDLIAGKEYVTSIETDRAGGTFMGIKYSYSSDGGATWITSIFLDQQDPINSSFVVPIDPQLTSAMFRVRIDFSPVLGANSHSEKTIGPFKILQPGSPSDVAAVANKDNSVTLTWNDNSNMETYYTIFRDGPDGSKPFYVMNTKDHMGPLSYVDQTTNPNDSIIYAYSLYTAIDQYALPDYIKPGPVSVLVKTKQLTPKITDPIKNNTDLVKPSGLQKKITDPTKGLLTDNKRIVVDNKSLITDKYADKLSQYILDADKVPVKNIDLKYKFLNLKIGESKKLIPSITPSDATNQKLTWSSVTPKVAVVDSTGKVTGISPGFSIIKAVAENGVTGYCNAKVSEEPIYSKPASDLLKPMATNVPTPAAPQLEFTDIAGHWANEDIKQAATSGIVSGYPDGTFRPDARVTRAEFAFMLMNGMKPTIEGAELNFEDKGAIGAWAIQAISKAVKLGIISGYSDGTFRPGANITHAEMIAMVVRASGLPMNNTQPTGYADDADIPGWAKPFVKTAELNGIIIGSGIAGTVFAPQAMSTRAEAASAIVKMLMGVRIVN